MEITKTLISWYKDNYRPLPWRSDSDPYKIWISEIILQQTRVEQGTAYYHRFLEAFPDIQSLAAAPTDKVLRLWQGLGYYSRARNLHHAAQTIVNQYSGKFPDNYKGLLKLKGVGTYTAAAIASIAFGEEVPVVDGNVARWLSRFYGVEEPVDMPRGHKVIFEIAKELIVGQDASMFNQAMMEMGALVCKPQPDCAACPLRDWCYAFQNKLTTQLPNKASKKKTKDRHLNYFVFQVHNEKEYIRQFVVTQRKHNDIWNSMYDYPCVETSVSTEITALLLQQPVKSWMEVTKGIIAKTLNLKPHKLSHQTLHIRFCYVDCRPHELEKLLALIPEAQIVDMDMFEEMPKPRPVVEELAIEKWGVNKN